MGVDAAKLNISFQYVRATAVNGVAIAASEYVATWAGDVVFLPSIVLISSSVGKSGRFISKPGGLMQPVVYL